MYTAFANKGAIFAKLFRDSFYIGYFPITSVRTVWFAGSYIPVTLRADI